MPGRKRTAKTLGTRHDLNYFKKTTLFRRWRLGLALGLPLLALAWLGGQSLRGRRASYSAGPLSSSHAFFGDQCAICHTGATRGMLSVGFRRHVADSACLACHQAPEHHAEQAFTPECSTCHREHTGQPRLAQVSDAQCAQCHGDLRPLNGPSQFVSHINGFNSNHPEFAPLRQAGGDPGTIAFNHYLHLNAPIMGPRNRRVQLQCADCHRPAPDAQMGWKYAGAEAPPGAAAPPPAAHMETLHPEVGRELMAPVTYQEQCAGCHTLQFDRRFAESVPHKQTDAVHAFVMEKFKQYLAANPNAWREPEVERRQPGYAVTVMAPSPNAWLHLRVAEAEQLLWRKTCKECHQLEYAAGQPLPTVKPAQITVRWLPHAVFSHAAHSPVQCESCHSATLASRETSDVLIPSIKTCQSCHNGLPTSAGHAENRCFECHQYHNWQMRQPFTPKYSIHDLVSDKQNAAGGSSARLAALLARFGAGP